MTTLDRERPISLSVMARPVRDDREGRQQIVACMRELRSGYRIADMSLWQDGSAKEEPSGHPRGSTLRVECIAGRAVVLDGTRIHVGRLPPGTESAPLRIVPAAAPLMLDGSRKADISVAAEGGLPPYAFEHAGPVPFTSFTPGGSVLHIDLPALWKGHAGRSSAAATYDEHEEPSSRKNMDALHRLIAGTSLPSEQSLVVLPLRLRVHDATGEIAELDFAFPVLVPRTELESALEAKCLRTRPKPPAPKKGSVAEQARALLEECKRLEEEVSNAEARILELRDTLKQ